MAFFGSKDQRQMLDKLEKEYGCFLEGQNDWRAAWDFFQTASAIPGAKPSDFQITTRGKHNST
jgi:hypothetical protein